MASVLGHALAATAISRAPGRDPRARLYSWPVTAAAVIVATLPDIDVFVWMCFKPEGMTPHRGFTHSILFALTTATIAWLILSRGARRGGPKLAAALYFAALSHPLLDYLMASGPALPLLWPFSTRTFLSPVQLVPTAYYDKHLSGFIKIITSFHYMKGVILELLVLVPIIVAQSKARPGTRLRWWVPALIISTIAEITVYVIYN